MHSDNWWACLLCVTTTLVKGSTTVLTPRRREIDIFQSEILVLVSHSHISPPTSIWREILQVLVVLWLYSRISKYVMCFQTHCKAGNLPMRVFLVHRTIDVNSLNNEAQVRTVLQSQQRLHQTVNCCTCTGKHLLIN